MDGVLMPDFGMGLKGLLAEQVTFPWHGKAIGCHAFEDLSKLEMCRAKHLGVTRSPFYPRALQQDVTGVPPATPSVPLSLAIA